MRHWTRARTLLGSLALLTAAFAASPAAARNCTAAQRATADAALRLSASERAAAIATHLPWGLPAPTGAVANESLLVQRDYVIGYDGDLRVPLWTAERIDSARLGRVPRADCFRADPRLPTALASTPADYREPIYDQGHMAPFANQSTSAIAGHNSFIMSNMAPQTCQLNRGIWQIYEEIVRRWAAARGTVFVLSGSIFDRDGNGERDADASAQRMHSNSGAERVAIPSAFYKIVTMRGADGRLATLALVLPHGTDNPRGEAALQYLRDHLSSVAAIERVTGLDLFPGQQDLGETSALWPFDGATPRSLCNQ